MTRFTHGGYTPTGLLNFVPVEVEVTADSKYKTLKDRLDGADVDAPLVAGSDARASPTTSLLGSGSSDLGSSEQFEFPRDTPGPRLGSD